MDFDLTEQQELLRRNCRAFMEREIIPIADEYDRINPFPKELALKLLKKHIPLGYLDGPVPAQYGGQGLDFLSYAMMLEEAGHAWGSLGGMLLAQTCGAFGIITMGNEEQRRRFLPPIIRGDKIGCFCGTEPNAGSNLTAIQTTATLDGKHYIINGTKVWVSNGTWADFAIVLALTRKEPREISTIIVEKEVSPFNARELPKLGLHAFPSAEVTFAECRVPWENLMAVPGGGYRGAMILLSFARCCAATLATGIAQAAVDTTITYAKERIQFDRPIGSLQLIQEMLVDMVTETQAARFLAYRACSLLDKGIRNEKEAAIAKAYATEAAVRVTSKAIQIHGAYGLSLEYPLERYFRDARTLTILDGTTEIMKLIAGRQILELSAFT